MIILHICVGGLILFTAKECTAQVRRGAEPVGQSVFLEPLQTMAGKTLGSVAFKAETQVLPVGFFFPLDLHSLFDDFRKDIHVNLTAEVRKMEGIISHSNSINA